MDKFIRLLKELRTEGIIEWAVIINPLSSAVFIIRLSNGFELQIGWTDFRECDIDEITKIRERIIAFNQ